MSKTIIEFVSEGINPPPVPEVAGGGATPQTGDFTWVVCVAICVLLGAVTWFIYRKLSKTNAIKTAAHSNGTFIKVNYLKLISIVSLSIACAMACYLLASNWNFAHAEDVQISSAEKVLAHVSEDGTVNIDKGFIKNESKTDEILLSNIKLACQDGLELDCNWTISTSKGDLYKGKADGTGVKPLTELGLAAEETAELSYSTDIDKEQALSLIGKQAVVCSFSASLSGFSVNLDNSQISHGVITTDHAVAKEGDTVKITYEPKVNDANYYRDIYKVINDTKEEVQITESDTLDTFNVITFKMPSSNVTVSATEMPLSGAKFDYQGQEECVNWEGFIKETDAEKYQYSIVWQSQYDRIGKVLDKNSSIKLINLDDAVVYCGAYTFKPCDKLESVVISSSLTELPKANGLFAYRTELRRVIYNGHVYREGQAQDVITDMKNNGVKDPQSWGIGHFAGTPMYPKDQPVLPESDEPIANAQFNISNILAPLYTTMGYVTKMARHWLLL